MANTATMASSTEVVPRVGALKAQVIGPSFGTSLERHLSGAQLGRSPPPWVCWQC